MHWPAWRRTLLHPAFAWWKGRVFGGGIPIRFEGQTIGAIGVSGGTVAEDITIAEADSAASW
ncbi:heme-binding protein [Sinorhizobium fredii]|uniref:heme-binding protein n=1 Tax=Rhizobium fredii TaxID=380 RepID=UPI0009B71327